MSISIDSTPTVCSDSKKNSRAGNVYPILKKKKNRTGEVYLDFKKNRTGEVYPFLRKITEEVMFTQF